MEENVAVTAVLTSSSWKRSLYNILSNVTYSPCHRPAGAPKINIQSTLRTTPDLCQHVSLALLFGKKR